MAHGRGSYTGLLRWALLGLIVGMAGASSVDAAGSLLRASGSPRSFEIKVAGGHATFSFIAIAGSRYRLSAEPGTLSRPILAIGRLEEEPFARVDKPSTEGHVEYVWDAEADAQMQVRVLGFSAQTGTGKLRLETLGPNDERVQPHRRFLWAGPERARVGDLLLGARNEWELVTEAGVAYEITTTRGSAGRVRLSVLGWDDKELANSESGATSWLAQSSLRFLAPPKPAPVEAPAGKKSRKRKKRRAAIRLEVRALLDGGGTYGVRMRKLDEGEELKPSQVPSPPAVERGPVEGERTTFQVGPGDVAIVYVPHSPQRSQVVEMLRGSAWVQLDDMGPQGSARSQEHALISWFRPYYPGTYRFRPVPVPPPSEPQLMLHDRAVLGSAPMHMGTGADPQVRARLKSSWTLVGLGVCMPGWDYLYVCVGGPDQGIAMRVRDETGKTIRTRSAGDRHISPGLGPSMRFKAPRAGVYRLEAKNGRKLIIRPLLRRASN